MPTIHANGINIEYEIHGTGEPLLLIAGLGYDRWMWHKMIPCLAEHFQVIVYDNRGVGGTDKPAGPYTAQLLADDAAALLHTLNITKAHLMGHSMGGYIAQALVLNHPQLVNKLILSATNFGGPHHVPVTQEALLVLMDTKSDPLTRLRNGIVISTASGFAENHPEIIAEWVNYRAAHPLDPLAYQAQLAIGLGLMSAEASFEGKLAQVRVPTLILFGAEDKVVPPGNAALLAQQIPDSHIVLLPQAGHFYPFEAPVAAADAVTAFLEM